MSAIPTENARAPLDAQRQALFVKEGKGSLERSDSPSQLGKVLLFYFVKQNKTKVSEDNMRREVIYGEISPNPLEHTNSCAVNLSPHRRTTSFHEAWSEAVAKDVLGHFDTLCPTCRSLKATWMVRPVFRYPTPVMRKWMRRHNVIA